MIIEDEVAHLASKPSYVEVEIVDMDHGGKKPMSVTRYPIPDEDDRNATTIR